MNFEWPEYPCPRFLLTVFLIIFGFLNGAFGLAGIWYGNLRQFYGSVSVSNQLRGQTVESLKTYLGLPQLLRHEEQAQVWHYEQDNCVLDIYLYPVSEENKNTALAVRYAEARSRTLNTSHFNEKNCLQNIVNTAQKASQHEGEG